MANPQAENGHVDIANEIIEHFAFLQLSGNQWRILWVIFRQTYGWKKKAERISVSYFERKTGLKRRHVSRALKSLIERKIVTKNDTTFITTYGFQKDYTKWEISPKKTYDKFGDGTSPKMTLKLSPKLEHIKEKKENSIKIDDTVSESFNSFYVAYPKHEAKKQAFDAWKKIYSGNGHLESILSSLGNQKKYKEYLINNKLFCPEWPLPATWLNGRRWEDEIPNFEKQGVTEQTLISCPKCGKRILPDDLRPDGRGCQACARSIVNEAKA